MIALVADKKDDIAALCRRFGIQRLDLFGSAATGTFDPATSDLDIVVDLGEYDDAVHRRYLDLITDLEDLLGYPVHNHVEVDQESLLSRRRGQAEATTL